MTWDELDSVCSEVFDKYPEGLCCSIHEFGYGMAEAAERFESLDKLLSTKVDLAVRDFAKGSIPEDLDEQVLMLLQYRIFHATFLVEFFARVAKASPCAVIPNPPNDMPRADLIAWLLIDAWSELLRPLIRDMLEDVTNSDSHLDGNRLWPCVLVQDHNGDQYGAC